MFSNKKNKTVSKRNNTEIESDHQKPKRRFIFSEEQKDQLMNAFKYDPYPAVNQMEILAGKLGLQTRTVINWFHNHRMRIRYKSTTTNMNGGQMSMSDGSPNNGPNGGGGGGRSSGSANYANVMGSSMRGGMGQDFYLSSPANSNSNLNAFKRSGNFKGKELSNNFYNYTSKNSQNNSDNNNNEEEDDEADYDEDYDNANYNERLKNGEYEMNEDMMMMMMNYEDSQAGDEDENDQVEMEELDSEKKRPDNDSNSNEDENAYNQNQNENENTDDEDENNEETDRDAEINSLYISQKGDKIDENNNTDNESENENEDENWNRKESAGKKSSTVFIQQFEENSSSLKVNKRRKPHNPQKLSMPVDLAPNKKQSNALAKCGENEQQKQPE